MKYRVLRSADFLRWLSTERIGDRTLINARLDRLADGHFGDFKIFDQLIELRWKNGRRIYAFIWERAVIVALAGGNKNGQEFDIKRAKKIRQEILNGAHSIYEP